MLATARSCVGAHLAVVPRFLYHLWGHPMGSTDEGIPFGQSVGQLRCNTEISELHLSGVCQQNIPTLDVPMDLQEHEALSDVQG